ncbi:hypothetical protein NDU88_007783 [Pleurodeles waltl]|uniref:Uncharacterized protein n=1 Tax=Pleurodeles waltl TaxID=8319 RepID=A0AAV7STQ7_PLEWA|nr:hypothetical protein NDU88_007783 [Pleurodeles waltl]
MPQPSFRCPPDYAPALRPVSGALMAPGGTARAYCLHEVAHELMFLEAGGGALEKGSYWAAILATPLRTSPLQLHIGPGPPPVRVPSRGARRTPGQRGAVGRVSGGPGGAAGRSLGLGRACGGQAQRTEALAAQSGHVGGGWAVSPTRHGAERRLRRSRWQQSGSGGTGLQGAQLRRGDTWPRPPRACGGRPAPGGGMIGTPDELELLWPPLDSEERGAPRNAGVRVSPRLSGTFWPAV